ncbi:hypothetical protein C8N39_10277 [Dietzia psychralcaliphila]|nr:hypothetical protein C8N39_10277 [Dietzia psychralcaliphila]
MGMGMAKGTGMAEGMEKAKGMGMKGRERSEPLRTAHPPSNAR